MFVDEAAARRLAEVVVETGQVVHDDAVQPGARKMESERHVQASLKPQGNAQCGLVHDQMSASSRRLWKTTPAGALIAPVSVEPPCATINPRAAPRWSRA